MDKNLNSLRICNQMTIKTPEFKEGFSYKSIDTDLLLKRIDNYVKQGIIVFINEKLSIPETIMKRQFGVKKITVSFIEPKVHSEWTPINEMENRLDNEGNKVLLDPLEYQVRNLTPIQAFKKVVRERIEPIININFEFLDEKENFNLLENNVGVVRVGFEKDKGSWSLVGLDHFFSIDEVTLNLGWIDIATILHELGHVVGLVHEHQGPFGKPIEWDEPVVYKWANSTYGWDRETTYNNIIKKYEASSLNGTDFDNYSVMLYFFPPELTKNKKGTSQNNRLSITDVKYINHILPGKDIDFTSFMDKIYPDQNYGLKYNGLGIGLTIGISICIVSMLSGLLYIRKRKKNN
jgi:uncharacterized protein YaaR (DUF327 family)